MAVTPDPVGAYNQSFQTADTSRRDYERLEMQRQQQAEAAVQRAREQKANDFKMMMEALGRQDTLKQQAIDNQFKKEQLANQTLTAQANAYSARNPTSRSGQGMLDIPPPGSEQPAIPGDGTTLTEVPPTGEGSVNTSGAEGELPTGTSGAANEPNLLLGSNPPTTKGAPTDPIPTLKLGDRLPPPQTQTPAVPPATPSATPTTPLGSPGLLPVSTPAFTPTPSVLNAGLMPRTVALTPAAVPAMDAPIATQTQPIPQPPAASTTVPAVSTPRGVGVIGRMLNMVDSSNVGVGIPRVAQTPETPMFGQADIATGGRDQLKQLASVIETAKLARDQASSNIDYARSLIRSGKLVPARAEEWTKYSKQQYDAAVASAIIEGDATQQLLEAEENIKGIEERQGALNRLGNLNGVLPTEERRQIYQEASDPRMAKLAEQKIAVLTEYDDFRQLNGITNASRGYRTAEQVVLAKRELNSKDAKDDQKLAQNAEAYKAYIKANPEMDSKTKEKLDLDIAEAAAAKIRNEDAQNRLNKALEADRLPPRPPATAEAVKPEDINVNPATGTTATDKTYRISQPMNPYQQQAAKNKAGSDAVWGALKRQAAPVVTEMDVGTLQDIVNGVTREPFSRAQSLTAPGRFDVIGVSPPSGTRVSKLLADTELKDLKLPSGYDRPEFTGRSTPLTAEDALIAAARDELRRRNSNAANAPVANPQEAAKLDAARAQFGIVPPTAK